MNIEGRDDVRAKVWTGTIETHLPCLQTNVEIVLEKLCPEPYFFIPRFELSELMCYETV